MLSVAEARDMVRAGFSVLSIETVGLVDALGRVLAEDVASRLSHPPVAVSAMDGYAVRAADISGAPVELTQIGESQAGGGYAGTVNIGETVRIFTGAPVPDGADAIVMQEITAVDGDRIQIKEAVTEGKFVRPAGLDFSQGDILLQAGTVLSARDIGLAAAMNVPWLTVRRRPRVAIASTGDELTMPGEPMTAEQIISSNSLAIGGYVEAFGGTPLNLGIARDTQESLRQVLEGARGADLLVTTGGASVGDYDVVRQVMDDDGIDLTFYKVAMRPGKPLIFGRLDGVPLLGLPGNPVSAGVTSAIFLREAMAAMLGLEADDASEFAVLGVDLPANDSRQDYLRAKLSVDREGNRTAHPFEGQDSSMLARLARADCLIVRPPEAPAAKAGERVEIIPLRRGMITF